MMNLKQILLEELNRNPNEDVRAIEDGLLPMFWHLFLYVVAETFKDYDREVALKIFKELDRELSPNVINQLHSYGYILVEKITEFPHVAGEAIFLNVITKLFFEFKIIAETRRDKIESDFVSSDGQSKIAFLNVFKIDDDDQKKIEDIGAAGTEENPISCVIHLPYERIFDIYYRNRDLNTLMKYFMDRIQKECHNLAIQIKDDLWKRTRHPKFGSQKDISNFNMEIKKAAKEFLDKQESLKDFKGLNSPGEIKRRFNIFVGEGVNEYSKLLKSYGTSQEKIDSEVYHMERSPFFVKLQMTDFELWQKAVKQLYSIVFRTKKPYFPSFRYLRNRN